MEKFELHEASIHDLDNIAELYRIGWRSQGYYAVLVDRPVPSAMLRFIASILRARFVKQNSVFLKISELSTSRIVACTILERPGLEQASAGSQNGGSPAIWRAPEIEGLDAELFEQFARVPGQASSVFGYNPARHFHRRGTHVHPDYRFHGLGKWLGGRCDEIVKADGRPCYVIANPNSEVMFEHAGYEVVGEAKADLSKWQQPDQFFKVMVLKPCQ